MVETLIPKRLVEEAAVDPAIEIDRLAQQLGLDRKSLRVAILLRDERIDERAGAAGQRCAVPLLYIRGGKDPVDTDVYVAGFRQAGVESIETAVIADAGHFVMEEKPIELAEVLNPFIAKHA